MPDETSLQPFIFPCQGGLVLNRSTFTMSPGQAFELQNFEPDIKGGYRRINGYEKWTVNVVPQSASETEKVLMSAYLSGEVIAARGTSVYRSSNGSDTLNGSIDAVSTTINVDSTEGFSYDGTISIGAEQITYTSTDSVTFYGCTRGVNSTVAVGHVDGDVVTQAWTEIESGRTSALKYTYFRYNLNGFETIAYTDGSNYPSYFVSGTSSAVPINTSNAPVDPKYVTGFKNTLFFAGMSANPYELVFTAPYGPTDFSPANGAGSIRVDSEITGIFPFRDSLFIFCEERIFRLDGSTISDFVLQPVSRNIGCINGFTIQEFGGDIIFLGRDGLRTVAGTEKIGDVELGAISTPVHQLFNQYTDFTEFDSLVIPDKTQYRIFFSDTKGNDARTRKQTKGVICNKSQDGYAFSETLGIQPSCTDSINYRGTVYAVHGGYDGYVYRQEKGNTFDGTTIIGKYRSPDITMGDAGIRKNFQRVIINYAPEGSVNSDLFIRYDYDSNEAPRPDAYPFDSSKVVAIYGVGSYGSVTYGGQSNPLIRQPIEGSGFAIAIRVVDHGVSVPYSLKGFQLEFDTGARR